MGREGRALGGGEQIASGQHVDDILLLAALARVGGRMAASDGRWVFVSASVSLFGVYI